MSDQRLRIGFLSCKNYFDCRTFSGILHSMYQVLSRHADVVPLGRPYAPTRLRELLIKIENRGLRQKRVSSDGDTRPTLTRFRRSVERQLSKERVDLVFAPVASQELSVMELKPPVVYASDTTCRLLHENYDFGVSAEQLAEAENAERMAIQKSAGIVYPSAWAAESAVRDYGASPEKICIIPYGANLDDVSEAAETTEKCGKLPWKITFIGLDWKRKGGDVALKAFEILRKNGLESELTIIGCEPPRMPTIPGVSVIPFLDKRHLQDRRKLKQILLSSHFLLFPTTADCSPIVLCEAAAYGMPVVAPNVGGISDIVTASNGRLLPRHSLAEDYAAAILELVGDPSHYFDLVRSSRKRYETVLNWDQWGASVVRFCRTFL